MQCHENSEHSHSTTSTVHKPIYFKPKIKSKGSSYSLKLWHDNNIFLHLNTYPNYTTYKPYAASTSFLFNFQLPASRFVFYSERIGQIEVQVVSHRSTSTDTSSIALLHHRCKFLVIYSSILQTTSL